MCTVSIHRAADAFELTMNRDELRSRAPELPLALHEANGVQWAAPLDSEAGGTWIGLNEFGLAACLLNHHPPDWQPNVVEERPSRGLIIPSVMDCSSAEEAQQRLASMKDLARYAPFLLTLVDAQQTLTLCWDERHLECEEKGGEWLLLASAGHLTEQAAQWRGEQFAEWRRQGCPYEGTIPQFHLLNDERHATCSPLLCTEHSSTRSITQIEVSESSRVIRYWPIAENRLGNEQQIAL